MKREALRQALELLPAGTQLTLAREELLEAVAAEPAAGPVLTPGPDAEEFLSAAEIATRYKVSKRWVYERQAALGGVRLSGRAVRFPARKVAHYVARAARAGREGQAA